jgi:hypothetical protein
MFAMSSAQSHATTHRLRFESLFDPGRALAFACDARGEVKLDTLSDRARLNYEYARAMVGVEYATPAVEREMPH